MIYANRTTKFFEPLQKMWVRLCPENRFNPNPASHYYQLFQGVCFVVLLLVLMSVYVCANYIGFGQGKLLALSVNHCHRLNCDDRLGGVMGSVLMCIFNVN